MSMEKSVWETEYKEKQLEVEEMYARLVEEVSVVALQYEDACEKQRKAAGVTPAAGDRAAGSPAGGGGVRYRAEMALQPEKLSTDSTGAEY